MIGLPSCARSPKLNGFDWVLERLCAGIDVTSRDIMLMGAGGLLQEIASRPQPRADAETAKAQPAAPMAPRIAALVLAAGQSRRMGASNKLLADVGGKPMLSHVLDAVAASNAAVSTVVLGHEAEKIAPLLAGRAVKTVQNPDYAQGLSTSLKAGLAALPDNIDGVLVILGDMPRITAGHIDKLIAAFNPLEGRAICVPTVKGKRGNPVLFAAEFIPEMLQAVGDAGAKHLIGANEDQLCEVPMDDTAPLLDIDTPEALATVRSNT